MPNGKPGEVRAWFCGQLLANIKAAFRTPDEKETELTADGEGYLRFESKQPGQYLQTIAHRRKRLAGFHCGVGYKEMSHNTALTWKRS